MANPYLCYAALLMAGLDGIQNKIHPGDPMDKNLYDLPPEELSEVPTVCSSLREALESLGADYEFLLTGRSGERRVGKECVSPWRSRWSPYHSKTKKTKH